MQVHAHAHRMQTGLLVFVLDQQYLDCFSAQRCRALNTLFSCVREERTYHAHTARSLGLEPSAIQSLFFAERLTRYPLPKLVLQGNVPLCVDNEDPQNFWSARLRPCSCIVERRRQALLEELYWARRITRAHRRHGLLEDESDLSSDS